MRNDSLKAFKEVSRRHFQFLVDKFRFMERLLPRDSYNRYEVVYARDDLIVVIRGEGYGSMASIYFQYQGNREVPIQFLLPGWEPFSKKKNARSISLPQDEQIQIAAGQMKEHCLDILNGEMTRYLDVFGRWNGICQKMGY